MLKWVLAGAVGVGAVVVRVVGENVGAFMTGFALAMLLRHPSRRVETCSNGASRRCK